MNSKEKRRDAYLRTYYNISLAQYNLLLRKQKGLCYICHRPSDTFKTALAVDHCHVNGTVRGLLCPWCNRGLRYYRDNPEWLRRAARHVLRDPLKAKVPEKYLKGRKHKRKKKKNK